MGMLMDLVVGNIWWGLLRWVYGHLVQVEGKCVVVRLMVQMGLMAGALRYRVVEVVGIGVGLSRPQLRLLMVVVVLQCMVVEVFPYLTC